MNPQYRRFHSQESDLNPPPSKKCIVPSCKFYGDPTLGMMCSSCFKQYTITESNCMAASSAFQRQHSTPLIPSTVAEEEEYLPQLMAIRCKTGCGYRCSKKTFPYCHECSEEQLQLRKARETAGTQEKAVAEAEDYMSQIMAVGCQTGCGYRCSRKTFPYCHECAEKQLREAHETAGTQEKAAGEAEDYLSQIMAEKCQTGCGYRCSRKTFPYCHECSDMFRRKPQELARAREMSEEAVGQNPQYLVDRTNPPKEGNASAAAVRKCKTTGCPEDAVLEAHCGRCFLGVGLKCDPATTRKLGATEVAPMPYSLSSAPKFSSLEVERGSLSQSKENSHNWRFPTKSNSYPSLPTCTDYVQNWLEFSGPARLQTVVSLEQRDELGEEDLIMSFGDSCNSADGRCKCTSTDCNNVVSAPGHQLCDFCQSQRRAERESDLNETQNCLEENCTFQSDVATPGYCSRHYRQLATRPSVPGGSYGWPEQQQGLGNSLASYERCRSGAHRCLASACHNTVQQEEGQLCETCSQKFKFSDHNDTVPSQVASSPYHTGTTSTCLTSAATETIAEMQPTSWRSAGGLPSQPTVSSFFKLSGDSQFQGVSQEQNDQRTSQPAVAQGPQTCFAPHCHTTISRGGGPLCESCWRILNVANQNGSAPSSKEKAELDTTRSQEVLKFCRLAVDAVESKDALAAFDNLEKALRVLTANHDN